MRAFRLLVLAALCAAPALPAAQETEKTATPAAAQKPGAKDAPAKTGVMDPKVKPRAIVTMVVGVEGTHRKRVARLERLIDIMLAKGAPGPLNTAFELRYREQETYEAAMAGFAKELGPELYARLRAQMDAGAGTPPPLRPKPPPPPPPPYVPPTQEQLEQQARDQVEAEQKARGEERGEEQEAGKEKP